MILGFISLLLVFSQYYIAKICVPYNVADSMLPCPVAEKKSDKKEENHRRLLWYERRVLAGGYKSSCKEVFCIQIYTFFFGIVVLLNIVLDMFFSETNFTIMNREKKFH